MSVARTCFATTLSGSMEIPPPPPLPCLIEFWTPCSALRFPRPTICVWTRSVSKTLGSGPLFLQPWPWLDCRQWRSKRSSRSSSSCERSLRGSSLRWLLCAGRPSSSQRSCFLGTTLQSASLFRDFKCTHDVSGRGSEFRFVRFRVGDSASEATSAGGTVATSFTRVGFASCPGRRTRWSPWWWTRSAANREG
jgi:hypothetical protein